MYLKLDTVYLNQWICSNQLSVFENTIPLRNTNLNVRVFGNVNTRLQKGLL